jgi:anaerobic carbon-monoxide dehydrogenase iron sulfur subunit
MMETPQKELVNGETWFKVGDLIPNVDKKLFALSNLCTDCKICEVACSLIHSPDGELNPLYSRIKIEHNPQVTSRVNKDGFGFVTAICHHCGNPPPCAEVCPTDAFYYDPVTLAAIIDQDKCIQCMECVPACPFDVVFVAPTGELLKCDLCGGEPACVKACSTRPDNLNQGKQYSRLPVLFFETKKDYTAIIRKPTEEHKEIGLGDAMLAGKISTAA